jgi:CheY-like chemotaxis protein
MTSAAPAPKSDRRRTILIVEDETLIRLVLADELEGAGYSVIEAETADQALRLMAERHDVDLVITDVRTPGAMTGLDVATWLREHRPAVKVVVMSGYVHEEVASVAAAFDAFVKKPFWPGDLLTLSATLLASA